MKVHRTVGGLAVAVYLTVPLAHAQSVERVAALDPAVAATDAAQPSVTPSPGAASAAAAPSEEATAAPAAVPAAVPAAPPPRSVPAPQSALSLGFDGRAKDAPAPPVSLLPIRSQRKLALLGEIGWNSLGGVGVMLTYNAHPHVAFDLAGGLSLGGWKTGIRGRYNLLTGSFTPFIGAGLSMSSGIDGARFGRGRSGDHDDDHDYEKFDPKEEGKYDVKRSEYAQAVIGFELMHRHGFTWQATAGYSRLLNRNNFTYLEGKRDDHLAKALFGSGPVAAMAFGYAFD